MKSLFNLPGNWKPWIVIILVLLLIAMSVTPTFAGLVWSG
jgi:hypothetical protein